MLLSAETINTRDSVLMELWEIGAKESLYVSPPIQPYFYSKVEMRGAEPVVLRPLSTLKPTTFWKKSFVNTEMLEANRNQNTIEDRFPFKQRIATDVGYKKDSLKPKIGAWDIETFVPGVTPDWRKDKIRSGGLELDDGTQFFWKNDPYTKVGEKKVCREVIKTIQKENIDVLADFYGRFYDIPTFMNRCANLGIRCSLARDGGIPYILRREFEHRGRGRIEHTIRMNGRIHFDVHKEAIQDYSLVLAGVNTNLYEVSTHFAKLIGFKPPISDIDHANIPGSKLEELNLDDCRVTMEVAKVYLEVLYEYCNLFNVPLNMIVERSPSHIPNYFYGKAFKERGIVSDGYAKERFPWVFAGKRSNEGGFGKIYKYGLIRNIFHHDWKSLYPSIMICFNLDPETVTLVGRKPYNGEYWFVNHGDYAIIEVPDVYHGQVVCKVDLTFDSTTRNELQKFLDIRSKTKIKSRGEALKRTSNSAYGYHIMPYSRYGNPLVGILVAAIGRHIIGKSIEGRPVILVATDGWYETEYDKELVDAKKLYPDCFRTEVFRLSSKTFDAMIGVNEKSYLLYKDGKIIRHGSGLLGRNVPKVCHLFLEDVAKSVFKGGNGLAVFKNYRDLSNLPLNMFSMSFTAAKRSYDKTSMYDDLLQRIKRSGVKVRRGEHFKYIKTVKGYIPTFLHRNEKVDFDYYHERLVQTYTRVLNIELNAKKRRRFLELFRKNTSMEEFT